MSGFDDNPFGEVDNPFADPAIQQVARNTNNTQRGLEEYNPFENDNQSKPSQGNQNNQEPAIVQPSVQSVPAYNRSGQQYQTNNSPPTNNSSAAGVTQISTAELQELRRRQEELERKAQELERREEELRNNTAGIRRNNWPPLPEKCCFQPCFYQDINVDIPSEFQRVVRHLYYLWMLYAAVMCVNVLGGMVLMFHASRFETFGLAILYAFLFTPISFICWYRPAYKAFRNDSSFNFMVFFFVFFFQMIIAIIQALGIPGGGSCGFITAIQQFDSSPSGVIVGLFLMCIAVGFGAFAAGNIMMLLKVHGIYRSSGASFAKAQAEFSSEFMRNEHVQRAASSAASAAVSSQFSGTNSNSSSRY